LVNTIGARTKGRSTVAASPLIISGAASMLN
jgi:hypothetical protein